ncbi:hypothetical protein AVEN_253476-1 [Araneus ventricosus]|uniref:Uncharacterized protein n=1 Tax=Araneus ventricosus TaxID=182803 RepID=A0A4Y2PR04_ARAVE|nr:hypothetical protein AVEN_253476-1 [Araneus ventricosus]
MKIGPDNISANSYVKWPSESEYDPHFAPPSSGDAAPYFYRCSEDFEPQPGPSTSTDDDEEYPSDLVHRQPHLVTQPELNDLERDLELPKSKYQLLGS